MWGVPALAGGPDRDTNETAVVTAWATAASGQGRARVRAILGVDNPWKHVCSNSSQDNPPGYCNEPANRNGNPTITPADPNDPNGPAAYDDLPRPPLGCSAIDRHTPRRDRGQLSARARTMTTPIPQRQAAGRSQGTGPRPTATGGGVTYQGYFDCALTTPCRPPSADRPDGLRACR